MWPNPQKTADLVAFTEEILNGKLQHGKLQNFLMEKIIGNHGFILVQGFSFWNFV